MPDGRTQTARLGYLWWRLRWELRFWNLAARQLDVEHPKVQLHIDEYMAVWRERHAG